MVLDDLSLDVVQGEIDVPRFLALPFHSVALGAPKLFGDGLFATELGYRTLIVTRPITGTIPFFSLQPFT